MIEQFLTDSAFLFDANTMLTAGIKWIGSIVDLLRILETLNRLNLINSKRFGMMLL